MAVKAVALLGQSMPPTLPFHRAEARMAGTDDEVKSLETKLKAALVLVEAEIERLATRSDA
jgi:hypothetical protein